MTTQQLAEGQKIQNEINTISKVLEHFQKWKSSEDKPVDFLQNYLAECRNVGNESLRETIATEAILHIITFLDSQEKELEKAFKAL